jgi:type VI protein secretion system component VasF
MPADPPAHTQPTLLDLCEPLFQYICRLNRASRLAAGGAQASGKAVSETAFFSRGQNRAATPGRSFSLDYAAVRAEVKALFEEIAHKAAADTRLAAQLKRSELPLVFFVDSLIAESRLPYAAQWNRERLAYERNELAGDEAFFDVVEETLKDPGEEATERLGLYYVCLGLGFTGINARQPEYLRRTLLAIAPRIRAHLDGDLAARICPETYAIVDTRNLVQPASNRLAVLGILFLCFALAVITSYVWMYRSASSGLRGAIGEVLKHDPASSQNRK